ncbi:MAG: TonB family protein [Novosphingobium sp.]
MSCVDISAPPRTRYLVAVLVALIHVVIVLGLIRAFAPDFSALVTDSVLATFNVTVTQPPPPPQPEPEKPGAAGEAGKKAEPREAIQPRPRIAVAKPSPAPPVSAKGPENSSGARVSGAGTGAGGIGKGTGSGVGGNGQGGGAASKPSVRAGDLNNASDFPVPEGGRQTRFGKRVVVYFTVTTDGRARDCSVAQSNVDAEATALVCALVIRKIRFNPATRADGSPVEARYGYKVDFTGR